MRRGMVGGAMWAVGVIVGVTACTGDAVAPPSRTVAAGLDADAIRSLAVAGDDLYWAGARDGDGVVGRVAIAGGRSETVATAFRLALRLVVADQAVYWLALEGDPFFEVPHLMTADADGVRELVADGYTPSMPLARGLYGVLVTAMGPAGTEDVLELEPNGGVLRRGTLSTRPSAVAVDGMAAETAVFLHVGDASQAIVVVASYGGASGFHDVGGVRGRGGVAFGGDRLYWVDGNYPGQPPERYRQAAGGGPERLGALPAAAVGPWWAAGRLWLLERGDGWAVLVAIDPEVSGSVRYTLDHVPGVVAMGADGLVDLDAVGGAVCWQPLPAR